MNCLIAAKDNPDSKSYMCFSKSHSDIWLCIMFVSFYERLLFLYQDDSIWNVRILEC